ncbi:MAG TPA: anaerobic ribonucleoside-triphosphate reductase activating protein [Coriobacteriia bacterium]
MDRSSELPSAPPHHAPSRRLAAWKPAGMSDWPGRVSATLYLAGCSLTCPYCPSLALRSAITDPADWDLIVSHIEERRGWLDGVVVGGGEPTEDPDLLSLLAALCDLGVAVRLDTNGTRPDVLRHVLAEGLADHVSLDVKALPSRYDSVAPRAGAASLVAESVELIIRSGVDHEFRTTVHPGCVALEELPRIARSLRGGRLYVLRQIGGHEVSGPDTADVPYEDDRLRDAASACSAYLPTIVRGLRSGVPG